MVQVYFPLCAHHHHHLKKHTIQQPPTPVTCHCTCSHPPPQTFPRCPPCPAVYQEKIDLAQNSCIVQPPPPLDDHRQALTTWWAEITKTTSSLARTISAAINTTTDPQKPASCLVLDIGANVGAFSYQLLQLRPECRVVAFEAIPWFDDENLYFFPQCSLLFFFSFFLPGMQSLQWSKSQRKRT